MKIQIIIFALVLYSGCSSVPKSLMETTLDDMYPILSEEQYRSLQSLNSDEEVIQFLDNYWQSTDSISVETRNELKNGYLERLKYANEYYPDRRGRGRSDRKRIYLAYGPPRYIERFEAANIPSGTFGTIKSMEIWLYSIPGKKNSLPSYGDDIYPGEMKFIFADKTGSGNYTIFYSTEDGGDTDIRWLKK